MKAIGLLLLAAGLSTGSILYSQTGKVASPPAPSQVPPTRVFPLLQCGRLPMPTLMHGSAVVGERLYTFGGNNEIQSGTGKIDRWPRSVYSAKILKNGQLGEWRTERPLPESRVYIGNSLVVSNNRIYVAGGNVYQAEDSPESAYTCARDVLWTTVQTDGSLSPWEKSEPFLEERTCASACASDQFLFLTGGQGANRQVTQDISVADITSRKSDAAEGVTGTPPHAWRQAGQLPIKLWFHGAGILDGRIYIWGGLTGNTITTTRGSSRTFSAEVQRDGSIGNWTEEAPMPTAVDTAGYCAFNDYLVCVGGRCEGGATTGGIWYTRLNNKHIASWQHIDTDLETRLYHSLGLDTAGGNVFISGGKFRPGQGGTGTPHPISVVQGFRLPQPDLARTANIGAEVASMNGANNSMLFNTFSNALSLAKKEGRPMLVYFFSPNVPAAQRFWDNVVSTALFRQLASEHILASVNATSSEMELCYKYSVFKVPCLVELDSHGNFRKMSMRIETEKDLSDFMVAKL